MEKVAFPSLFQTIKCQNRWELGHLILLCMMQTIFFHQSSSSIQPNPTHLPFSSDLPLLFVTLHLFAHTSPLTNPTTTNFIFTPTWPIEETVQLSGNQQHFKSSQEVPTGHCLCANQISWWLYSLHCSSPIHTAHVSGLH